MQKRGMTQVVETIILVLILLILLGLVSGFIFSIINSKGDEAKSSVDKIFDIGKNTNTSCTPNCSCASDTCLENTCSDGCKGLCQGTKADCIIETTEENPTIKINQITIDPRSGIEVKSKEFFLLVFNVTCLNANCGNINITLDPEVVTSSPLCRNKEYFFSFMSGGGTGEGDGIIKYDCSFNASWSSTTWTDCGMYGPPCCPIPASCELRDKCSELKTDINSFCSIRGFEYGEVIDDYCDSSYGDVYANVKCYAYSGCGSGGTSLINPETVTNKENCEGKTWGNYDLIWKIEPAYGNSDCGPFVNDSIGYCTLEECNLGSDCKHAGETCVAGKCEWFEAPMDQTQNKRGSQGTQTISQIIPIEANFVPATDKFYTNESSNPFTINLDENESQLVSFWINSTGESSAEYPFYRYNFFAYANQTSGAKVSNTSKKFFVDVYP